MGRTLEQILQQEDPQMVAEARKLAAEMLRDIEKTENSAKTQKPTQDRGQRSATTPHR